MSTLLCFGLGYSAEHFIGTFGDGFEHIVGTVRGAERAALLSAHFAGRLRALVFDGSVATPQVKDAIGEADLALVSIPPNENGDAVLTAFGDALLHARRLRSIVYLSTVGVYGNHDGAWVDEETPARPGSARSRERAAAEQAWQKLGCAHRRRSRHLAARRHLRTRPECARASRQRQSPAHCESRPGLQSHPCGRHRPGHRRGLRAQGLRHLQRRR